MAALVLFAADPLKFLLIFLRRDRRLESCLPHTVVRVIEQRILSVDSFPLAGDSCVQSFVGPTCRLLTPTLFPGTGQQAVTLIE